MTPLERAARALHKDYVEGRIRMGVKPSDLPAWEDLGPDGEFAFYAPARAVIEEIREASEAMEMTGYGNSKCDPDNTGIVDNPRPDDAWRAMIDALLEEGA